MMRHAHTPLQRTDTRAQRFATIDAAAALDVYTWDWTEVEHAEDALRIDSLRGIDTWFPVREANGRPADAPKNFAPISWRTDRYELVRADAEKACDGKRGVSPSRYFHRVTLRDVETREITHRVSGHFVAGIQSLRDETPEDRRYTIAAHADCVRTWQSLMLRGGLTIGGCDANTTEFPGMVDDRIRFAATGPTHGKRRIDYVAAVGVALDGRTLRLGNSDHRAVIAHTATQAPEEPPTMLPADLPEILRDAGLRVVELDGWRTRGRPGPFTPVGVLCHHTASSADGLAGTRILVQGRSDLPGPLSQLGLSRDGTVYIVAAGRSNHAGRAKSSGTVAAGDGNTLYIGVEAMNRGTGEPWPKAQYDAYVTLAATLSTRVTGNSVNTVRAHKETSTTGKIDPAGPTPYGDHFDMDDFRSLVGAAMSNARPTTEEDDVTPEQIQEAVRNTPLGLNDGKWNATLEQAINHIEQGQDKTNQLVRALAKALGPEVEAAVERALADAVVSVDVTVTGKEA